MGLLVLSPVLWSLACPADVTGCIHWREVTADAAGDGYQCIAGGSRSYVPLRTAAISALRVSGRTDQHAIEGRLAAVVRRHCLGDPIGTTHVWLRATIAPTGKVSAATSADPCVAAVVRTSTFPAARARATVRATIDIVVEDPTPYERLRCD